MAIDTITIARPYAKAAFEYANEHNELGRWSEMLHLLASIVSNKLMQQLIKNPSVSQDKIAQILIELLGEQLSSHGANFLQLLGHTKRLSILQDVYVLFEQYRSEVEKTIDVNVSSYMPLNDNQQTQLIESLKKRLQRDVTLHVEIDKSLLGGAIIRAGDLVIDGSVRGKLNKLSSELAA